MRMTENELSEVISKFQIRQNKKDHLEGFSGLVKYLLMILTRMVSEAGECYRERIRGKSRNLEIPVMRNKNIFGFLFLYLRGLDHKREFIKYSSNQFSRIMDICFYPRWWVVYINLAASTSQFPQFWSWPPGVHLGMTPPIGKFREASFIRVFPWQDAARPTSFPRWYDQHSSQQSTSSFQHPYSVELNQHSTGYNIHLD